MKNVFGNVYLLILLIGISFSSYSQDIKDLQSNFSGVGKRDKINLYLKIGKVYSDKYGKPDSMLYFSKLAYKTASELNDQEGKLKSLLHIGIAYTKKYQFDTATAILNNVLAIEKIHNNSKIKSDAFLNLGSNFYQTDDNKSATEFFIKAISVYETIDDKEGLASANCGLANVFSVQKQFDQSILYASKAKKLIPEIKDIFTKISVLTSLTGVYVQVATQNKNYSDTSILYCKQALDLAKKNFYYNKASQLSISLSNAYTLKSEYEQALAYCKDAISYKNYLFPNEIMILYFNLSDCYNNLKQSKLALTYLDSIKLVLKSAASPFYEVQLAERIYAYNKDAGNYPAALEGLEKYGSLHDSLFTIEKNNAVNELEQQYNKSQNEKTISELNQKSEIDSLRIRSLIAFTGIAVLIIIIGIFFYRQSVIKNKLKTIETEQRLNRARMNPHFFFNAMASLQNLSLNDSKKELVPSFISKFSRIMRQSLESTFHEMDTIENEISFLTDYLELQKLRSENRFNYSFNLDDKIESSGLLIPGMILQPFIENSIEHGFKNISYQGQIDINFNLIKELVVISIMDNGQGIKNDEKHKSYPSRATQIIRDRLYLLNQQYKTNATFVISDSEQQGIKVEISLPVIYKT